MLGDVPTIILNHSYLNGNDFQICCNSGNVTSRIFRYCMSGQHLKHLNVQKEICWAMTGFSNDFSTVQKQRLFSMRLGLVKDLGNLREFINIQAYRPIPSYTYRESFFQKSLSQVSWVWPGRLHFLGTSLMLHSETTRKIIIYPCIS